MAYRHLYRIYFFLLCFLTGFSLTFSETITGAATIQLKSAVTPELKKKQMAIAKDSLSRALIYWINDFFGDTFNPKNVLSKRHEEKFIQMCLPSAKVNSFFKGHAWTIKLTILNNDLDSLISSYNNHFDSLALECWDKFNEAQKTGDLNTQYVMGLKSLNYSMAHIGSPVEVPGFPDKSLTQHLQKLVQKLIEKIKINLNTPIIEGQPPYKIKNNVTMKVTIDTIPLSDSPLIGILTNGRKIYAFETDSYGNAALSSLKVPFVPKGDLLHIQPNFGVIIEVKDFIEAKSLGLTLSDEIDQTLMFNIIKPVYKLDYKAYSVSDVTIPTVFSTDNFIHNFLIDSCSLKPANGNGTSDISIAINCQVAKYTYDNLEQTHMKVETNIKVKDLSPNGFQAELSKLCYEQHYNYNITIPVGLFFWESSTNLRSLIREALDKL
jgi:hypothetical protein